MTWNDARSSIGWHLLIYLIAVIGYHAPQGKRGRDGGFIRIGDAMRNTYKNKRSCREQGRVTGGKPTGAKLHF